MILVLTAITGCANGQLGGSATADADEEYKKQVEVFHRQAKDQDEITERSMKILRQQESESDRWQALLNKQESLADRYDKLLGKLEEQARRQDAILDAEEKRVGLQQ